MMMMTPLYDKQNRCIFCNHSFVSKSLRSRFVKLNTYDSDFCPNYKEAENNPIYYHVKVCPACGFSYTDDFSSYFPPETKEIIEKNVHAKWVPHSYGKERTIEKSIQTYKLSVYCGILKKEKHVTIAGLYMRIAWQYRYLHNEDQEQRFLTLALKEYANSYSTGDYQGKQMSDIKILYLLGEISRRLSDIDSAKKYFSKVIEQQSQSTEPTIVQMAKERWRDIKENVQKVSEK
ncbi:DUF2225 domain-containing protein [Bacillaceae bacterium Marseille-Q3522]|nr:DUF2225 domain-containing protein [Bacillaceae bacterium Marseille-Q3522]